MRLLLLLISFLLFTELQVFSITYTVGPSGDDYTTITDAYLACTTATSYIIEIQSDYVYSSSGESAGITLGALPSKDAINTVTIRPALGANISLSGSTSFIITFSSTVNWLIIDGRAGGVGSTSALEFENTNSSSGKRVFIFSSTSSNNVLKHCTIKGANASTILTSTGIVTLLGTSNKIDSCTFQESSSNPNFFIKSTGGSSNIISNCKFINFKSTAIHVASSTGITISGNHFYQTAAQTPVANVSIILINSNNGHTISGNYFGGQAPNCGGSSYTLNSSAFTFRAIDFQNSTAGTNTISNNTISNLTITTTSNVANTIAFIHTQGSADYDINNNSIGATSGTGNIQLSINMNAGNYYSLIHLFASGDHTVSNNTFGSIDFSTTYSNIYPILIQIITDGNVTIDSNTLGNATANNITADKNSGTLFGIHLENSSTPTLTISNNLLQNFTIIDGISNENGSITGIYVSHASISTNTLKAFTNNNTSTTDINDAIIGIYSLGSTISENQISDFVSSYTGSNSRSVIGISVSNDLVYQNKITGLSNASSNSNSTIEGITSTGSAINTIYNNIILLTDGTNTVSKNVRGIADHNFSVSSDIIGIYHNTVKINTNYTSGTGISSAFYVENSSLEYEIKNNIFQNVSSGSGTHYAQFWGVAYGTPSNIRNNYNEASIIASWGGVDKTSIGDWRTEISDASNTEITGSITVSSATGKTPDSNLIGRAGTAIPSVTTDYELTSRDASQPSIGAFELIIPLPIELLKISAKCQKSKMSNSEYGATIQWTTATEKNSFYFIVEGSKNGFDWENLDTIDGAGTKYDPTNYYYHENFINPTPENETVVYYRVSQTDFDGVVNTYDILSCKCEASAKIKIHPIPSKESIVINFGDQNNVPNTFQITDMFGHIIEDITINGDKANYTSYKLDIRTYPSGRYIIKINDWKMKEDGIFIKE